MKFSHTGNTFNHQKPEHTWESWTEKTK